MHCYQPAINIKPNICVPYLGGKFRNRAQATLHGRPCDALNATKKKVLIIITVNKNKNKIKIKQFQGARQLQRTPSLSGKKWGTRPEPEWKVGGGEVPRGSAYPSVAFRYRTPRHEAAAIVKPQA